ncbi:MAG: glutamate--cysteine ligase [Gemmatimonadetes bacterium]|nr:glutamate--cysteine ligase [Gemmatimonadota bacterium]
MSLSFTASPEMNLGVELELQILHPETKDLAPGAPRVLERLSGSPLRVKPEIFQGMLEINTGICENAGQVRADFEETLAVLRLTCADLGLELAAAGSHPFARYRDRAVYPTERYWRLIDRHRWLARRRMIFGLHVHVGMRDGDHAMAMVNGILPYLPHLLALSASSPFWQETDTGLASSRITFYEALPTAGTPCTFADWAAFVQAYDAMVAAKGISSASDIWWDVRPSPGYGTVEVRICDAPPTLSEVVALAGLVHTLFAWCDEAYRDGQGFLPPPYWMLRENKWRASRWGVDARIVLDEKGRTGLLRDEIERVLDVLAPTARALGCAQDLEIVKTVLAVGPSYERQRRIFEEQRSLRRVVEALIEEFATDMLGTSAPSPRAV